MTITIDVMEMLAKIVLMSIVGIIACGSLFALFLHAYQGLMADILTGIPDKDTTAKAKLMFYCYAGMLSFIMIFVFAIFILVAVNAMIWVNLSA